jgi:hypothetical protein
MLHVIDVVLLLATVALLSWASRRAWRHTNRVLKWGGAGLAALLAPAVAGVSVLTLAGLVKLHTRRAPVPALTVAGTPDHRQRGQAIAASFCDACHSTTGPLTGGEDIGGHFPMPVGSFVARAAGLRICQSVVNQHLMPAPLQQLPAVCTSLRCCGPELAACVGRCATGGRPARRPPEQPALACGGG